MEKSKTRLPEWDFVKAVLIIFVVWGHICSYISDSSYDKNALTALIRLYQMPMFILISGFFQRPCRTFSEIKEKGIKIFKSLCIPYLCWCFVGCLTVIGFNTITHEEIAGGQPN